jgi:hypothetical protein
MLDILAEDSQVGCGVVGVSMEKRLNRDNGFIGGREVGWSRQ